MKTETYEAIKNAAQELVEKEGGYIIALTDGAIEYTSGLRTGAELVLTQVDNLDDLGDWNEWQGARYDEFEDLPAEARRMVIGHIIELAEDNATAAEVYGNLERSHGGDDFTAIEYPCCPICGMKAQSPEKEYEHDPKYACGHYTGSYNEWYDDNAVLLSELSAKPTHEVTVSYCDGGNTQFFFRAEDETLTAVMTIAEVAARYPISVEGVTKAIQRGRIGARQSGSTWLLLRSDVESRWSKEIIDQSNAIMDEICS